MNYRELIHAIANAKGSVPTAHAILKFLKERTGTTGTLVYGDVSELFEEAVADLLQENFAPEKLVLLDLVDGKPDEAAARYEKLIASAGGASIRYLRRMGALLTPTHPGLARRAFERILAMDPLDAEARLGHGFALLGLGEFNPAGVAFVSILEGLQESYRLARIFSVARALHLGAPNLAEARLVHRAFNGMWRVRLAQQFPKWARMLYRSSVMMHENLAKTHPRLAARAQGPAVQVWDQAAACVLTYELIMSAYAALAPHFNMRVIEDAALCPAPVPFSPQGPGRSSAYDPTQSREEAFNARWNRVRFGMMSECKNAIWKFWGMETWTARMQQAMPMEQRARLSGQSAAEENIAVGVWLLTFAYGQAPDEPPEVLLSLGQMCQKITQAYAYTDW